MRSARFSAAVIALGTLLLATACEPGEFYTIVNESDQTIEIVSNGGLRERLAPGEEFSLFIQEPPPGENSPPQSWIVLDDSGAVLSAVTVTWDDFVARDFRVVVP